MGTSWSLSAFAPPDLGAKALRNCARQVFERIIALFSPWSETSEITRINRDPGAEITVSAGFAALLGPMLQLARDSAGASDPALGALVNLWGFGPEGPRAGSRAEPPSAAEIRGAQSLSGSHLIDWQPDLRRLRRPPGLLLDFSGSAKGLAADHLSAALTRAGVASHLTEIGGECIARGLKPDFQPWWLGLEPATPASRRWRLALNGQALATSGTALRQFSHQGRRYSHIIDPATGEPLCSDLVSASVLAQSCAIADAQAKACLILPEVLRERFMAGSGIAALLQYGDGSIRCSPAWQAMAEEEMQDGIQDGAG